MVKVVFVCLGNICRSPMAEFILKNIVKSRGLEENFLIESRGTSDEENGNDMDPRARAYLDEKKVPYEPRKASRLQKEDYDKYDFLITMDDKNMYLRGHLRRALHWRYQAGECGQAAPVGCDGEARGWP